MGYWPFARSKATEPSCVRDKLRSFLLDEDENDWNIQNQPIHETRQEEASQDFC